MHEITTIQRLTSKCESLSFDDFVKLAEEIDNDSKKVILQRFASIRDFYKKNLTIYPEFDKKGDKNYVYSSSKRKLNMISKKGKHLAKLLNEN